MTNSEDSLRADERAEVLRAMINERAERLREIESEALDTWSDSGMRRLRTERDALKAQIRDLEAELSALLLAQDVQK